MVIANVSVTEVTVKGKETGFVNAVRVVVPQILEAKMQQLLRVIMAVPTIQQGIELPQSFLLPQA